MPRTESPKKRSVRFCRDCGYELARDNDGTCPMCARLRQLRMDFTVPRPNDGAAHRAGSRNTDISGVADEWPPTVAEYGATLAERGPRSVSPGQHAARVIRTPALRQSQVPSPHEGSTAPGDGVSASLAEPKPPAKDLASPPPTKAKVKASSGPGTSRGSARAHVRSSGTPGTRPPPATASPSAPVESGDVPATPSWSTPPTAVAAVPRQGARPVMQAGPVRHKAPGSHTGVPWSSLIILAIILIASALIGAAVPILLSSR